MERPSVKPARREHITILAIDGVVHKGFFMLQDKEKSYRPLLFVETATPMIMSFLSIKCVVLSRHCVWFYLWDDFRKE